MTESGVSQSEHRVEYRVVIVRRVGDALARRVEIIGNERACWERQCRLERTHPDAKVTVEKRVQTPWEECDVTPS